MDLKGSKTEKNLLKSFAGESQARNRYTYFSGVAKNEGYVQISAIFSETADNESIHAKRMFKFLESGSALEITASYSAGRMGKTAENLEASAAGENEEHTLLYPSFAKTAREEGFDKVDEMYENISVAEQQHEKRYRALLANVKNGTVFKKDKPVTWRCSKCGFIHTNTEALAHCPACNHPQAHFEILAENW